MLVIDLVIAAAPWVFVISRSNTAWTFAAGRVLGAKREADDWPAFSSWLFALFMAIGLTFRVVPFRGAFDSWIGVPNLGWFLSFVSESVAIYVAACGCRAIPRVPVPRWLHVFLIAELAVFSIIYATNLIAGPERLEYPTAETLAELIFMSTKYVSMAVMTFLIARTFTQLRRNERNTLTRLRLSLLSGSAMMGVVYGAVRMAFVHLEYVHPTHPALDVLHLAEIGALLALCLMWPLSAMLSSRTYLLLSKPLEYLHKSATLHDLKELQVELSRLGLLTVWDERPMPRRSSLDLRVYRALISILDGKRLLQASSRTPGKQLEEKPGNLVPERRRSIHSNEKGENRNDAIRERAKSLRRLLDKVDDGLQYYDLTAAYRDVGRMLRRNRTSPGGSRFYTS